MSRDFGLPFDIDTTRGMGQNPIYGGGATVSTPDPYWTDKPEPLPGYRVDARGVPIPTTMGPPRPGQPGYIYTPQPGSVVYTPGVLGRYGWVWISAGILLFLFVFDKGQRRKGR